MRLFPLVEKPETGKTRVKPALLPYDRAMIEEISLANFKAFLLPCKLSLRAKKAERLLGNMASMGRSLTYKSAAIFSGNNVGKTSFLLAVLAIKHALTGTLKKEEIETNVHSKDKIARFSITFSDGKKRHRYSFAYDVSLGGFSNERIDGDEHPFFHKESVMAGKEAFAPFLEQGRKIEVLFMDELPRREKKDPLSDLLLSSLGLRIEEGHEDLSSLGTRRAEALVPFVVDALIDGKALFIDEFDSGLSFVLTRAIVSLFNNIDNPSSQLVFASHDVTLLDTKRLFLLPQIKLVYPKGKGASIVSLEKLVKEGDDPLDLFLRGKLGSINRAGLAKFLVELNRRRNRG